MRPINFAVVINQQISIGGGYQQALNAALLTRNLSPNLVNLFYFTTVRDNVQALSEVGIQLN